MDEVFERALLALGKTVSSFEGTIQRIEESIKCLNEVARNVTKQAQQRALERLDSLVKSAS